MRDNMADLVHGHEVKEMVIESGDTHTRDSLIATIVDKFGEETRFYSCSADNMTADELVSFFERMGKLNTQNYTFLTDPEHAHSH